MRIEQLKLYPFEDLRVSDYKSVQQVNEHAWAEIKGMIPFERKKDYMEAGRKHTWVQVTGTGAEEELIVFCGIMEQLKMDVMDGTCIVTLKLRSGTFLMDFEEHIRSFQEGAFTYSQLLDICNSDYENAEKIMTEAKGKTINCFIMQYGETNWSFIKRLASMNHTVVFADCSTRGEKYHFGIPDRKGSLEVSLSEYRRKYDMEEYWNKKNSGLDIHPEDTMSYILEDRDIHKLGEKNTIEGRELFIWKLESYMKGEELYYTSFMKARPGFLTPVKYNHRISGVALLGHVIKVKDEKVQVSIVKDENQEESGFHWFSFSTVYSSADGSGWYCMPEPGDKVRMYFPSIKESEAYVASAYHDSGAVLRNNPECKFWRNKEGKEIQLSPERILLTNNDGTYIELSDERGIHIASQGSVTISAEDSLEISSSNSSIELIAPKRIKLMQGDTEMELGGNIGMQGAKVML